MDAMLWILISLAAGLVISMLSPETGERSLSRSGARRIRGMAAGIGGGGAGPVAVARLAPPSSHDGLTMALLALAGALWVSAIVEAYASRWQRSEVSELPVAELRGEVSTLAMPAYDAARQALVAGLIEDALSHEAGRYAEIGRQFPAVRD